jgi:hypothetical protein
MAMQGQRFSSSWPVRPRRLPVKKGLHSSFSVLVSFNYHSEAIIRLFFLPTMKATSLLVTLLTASSACAHGFLSMITINDKTYTSNNPFGANDASVIRKVSSPDPNYGTSNRALTCGPSASAASLVADANPGDIIKFDWRGADNSRVRSIQIHSFLRA